MNDFIPVNEPLLDGNEKKYLLECIETGWISSEGPFVRQFEEKFAAKVGRQHGIAVANGTGALDIAVQALQLGVGDEVILPTFTIISCAASIVRAGATPVLVDADPVIWNMSVDQVALRITSRTKAIMVVHIYGLPVDMDPIIELAQKHGLKIIEDAAEMHGQTYRSRRELNEERGVGNLSSLSTCPSSRSTRPSSLVSHPSTIIPCGSFGDISTFSFYPNKHITTGEGGMLVCDDPQLAERCRGLRNLCFQAKKRFVHEELGWNYRMTNLQAALGLAQLEKLGYFVERKRAMGQRYTDLLKDINGIQLPLERTEYAENIYWIYGMVLGDFIRFDAEDVMKRLAEAGIGTRPFFWPMHEQPVFRKMGLFAGESYPVAERLARRGFYLPSGLALSEQQMARVITAVKEVLA